MKRGRVSRRVRDGVCEVDVFDTAGVARAVQAVPAARQAGRVAEALRVLGHPARLQLVIALEGRELCVCDCSQVIRQSMSGTSQHLKELRRLGAITFRTQGKMAYYRLADRRWLDLVEQAVALVTALGSVERESA